MFFSNVFECLSTSCTLINIINNLIVLYLWGSIVIVICPKKCQKFQNQVPRDLKPGSGLFVKTGPLRKLCLCNYGEILKMIVQKVHTNCTVLDQTVFKSLHILYTVAYTFVAKNTVYTIINDLLSKLWHKMKTVLEQRSIVNEIVPRQKETKRTVATPSRLETNFKVS